MKNTVSLFVFALVLSRLTLANPHSATFVTCKSLDKHADFTIQFIGEPENQRTNEARFLSAEGKLLLRWTKINGMASRGFIKIAQTEVIGPDSTLQTTILTDDYNPGIAVNTPFLATYRQWALTSFGRYTDIAEYPLFCTSPY